MTISPGDNPSHPYQYGQLIDIFTVPIHYKGTKQISGKSRRQEVQVLWVRWFKQDSTYKDGFSHLRIPQIEFVEPDDTDKWHSFISPSEVLRATHLVPGFAWGLMESQLCPKGSHAVRFLKDDWNYYYVNM